MTNDNLVSGESASHKVSAEFENKEYAQEAAQMLRAATDLPEEGICIVHPDDANLSQKVEPEVRGIARTLVKSHVVLGLCGLAVGLAIAAALLLSGVNIASSSPTMTVVTLGFVCSMLGLLLAGLFSLRPDHDPLIAATRNASNSGRWSVIAHCTNHEQQYLVEAVLGRDARTL